MLHTGRASQMPSPDRDKDDARFGHPLINPRRPIGVAAGQQNVSQFQRFEPFIHHRRDTIGICRSP